MTASSGKHHSVKYRIRISTVYLLRIIRTVHFKADKDGTLSFETMDSYIQGGRLEEPEVTFADGRLTLSYMTEVLVMPGREYIEGRMTSVWRCISSKEREQ